MKSRALSRIALSSVVGAALVAGTATVIHADDQAASKPKYFSFAGKRPTFKEENVKPEVALTAVDSAGRISVIDEIWSPGFKSIAHLHKKHAETFYVISGMVEWTVGGQTQVLGAGDLVHIPPNTAHTTRVLGTQDVHTLMLFEPGGFEENVAYMASLTPQQLKDPKVMQDLAERSDFYPVAK